MEHARKSKAGGAHQIKVMSTIGPRGAVKTFQRRIRAALAHPEIQQAVIVIQRRGPQWMPRTIIMDERTRIMSVVSLLEVAKLDLFAMHQHKIEEAQ